MSDTEATGASTTTDALTKMIDLLRPLDSEERRRTVGAAMLFLGETAAPISVSGTSPERETTPDAGDGSYSTAVRAWMKQNDISSDELDRVFHLRGDGTFDILDVPGRTKKDQTLNTYVLTGLGRWLAS